jgi:hypothetical protein
VSKKLTPSSTARRTAAADSSSSTSPQPSGMPSMLNGPPIAQHPNPISLTSMPLRPKTLPIAVPSLNSRLRPSLGHGARSRSSGQRPAASRRRRLTR